MKKRFITYLVVVCSICLHIVGFANPAKASRTVSTVKSSFATTSRTSTFKKASPSLTDYLPHKSSNIFFQYGSIRVLYPVTSYFKAESNFFFTISNHVPSKAISEKEIERVLKDHLLHLFPSHYFW